MEYSKEKLRSVLGKHAIESIEELYATDNKIYVKFKEGCGTSWHSDWYKSEITVNNLTELKEACKKSYIVEAENRYKEENGIPLVKPKHDPQKDALETELFWTEVFRRIMER